MREREKGRERKGERGGVKRRERGLREEWGERDRGKSVRVGCRGKERESR